MSENLFRILLQCILPSKSEEEEELGSVYFGFGSNILLNRENLIKMQPQVFAPTDEIIAADQTPNDLLCCQPQVPVLAELLCSDEELMNTISTDREREGRAFGEGEDAEGGDVGGSVPSYFDPVILHHPNVLRRLQFLESSNEKPRDYFRMANNGSSTPTTTKDDILPYMRKVVASWMLEVCEEQRCEEAVFPLAVAILDRFLGCTKINKEQLQLAASVCLLLASKTRQCNHFSLDLLCWYTDNSVSPNSLRSWELMILSQLNWDVNVITATDFVDYFLVRSPGQPSLPSKRSLLVRRHAITFIALCSTEPRFVGLKPSLIAASAIYTALKGIRSEESILSQALSNMANVTVEQLLAISSSIEQVISNELAVIEQQTVGIPHVTTGKHGCITGSAAKGHSSCVHNNNDGQNTPTDVQDIIV